MKKQKQNDWLDQANLQALTATIKYLQQIRRELDAKIRRNQNVNLQKR